MKSYTSTSPSESEGIFERSCSISMSQLPCTHKQKLVRTMSNSSLFSSASYAVPTHHSTEDFIAPVLDTTTEILSNPSLDLSNVNIICRFDEDEENNSDDGLAEDVGINSPIGLGSDDDNINNNLISRTSSHKHKFHERRSRSRSRSRSLICNSLMSSMAPLSKENSSISVSGGPHSSSNGPCISSTVYVSAGSSSSMHELDGNTNETYNMSHSYCMPSSQSANTNFQSGNMDTNSKTINFYSFADVLEKEREPDAYDDCNSSGGISPQAPPSFKRFSFSGPSLHNKPNSSYSISQTTIGPNNDNLSRKSVSSNSDLKEPVPEGFTAISMKDYISKLT